MKRNCLQMIVMSGSAPPLWNPSGMGMKAEPPSQLRPNSDHYNNNPHSRNPTAQGGGQDDTWGWGWDDDSPAQDENEGWGGSGGWQNMDGGQQHPPPPPATHHYPPANVAPPTKPLNSSDFFENIDHAGKNLYPADNNNKFQDRFTNSPALTDQQYAHQNTMQQVPLRGKEEENHHQQQQQQQQQSYSYFQFSQSDNQAKLNSPPIPDLFGPPGAAPSAYNNVPSANQPAPTNSYTGIYNNHQLQNDTNISSFSEAEISNSSAPPKTANAYFQPQPEYIEQHFGVYKQPQQPNYGEHRQNYGDQQQSYGVPQQKPQSQHSFGEEYGVQQQKHQGQHSYGEEYDSQQKTQGQHNYVEGFGVQQTAQGQHRYGEENGTQQQKPQGQHNYGEEYGSQQQKHQGQNSFGEEYGSQQQKSQGQHMMYPYGNSNVDSYSTSFANGAIQQPPSTGLVDSNLVTPPPATSPFPATTPATEVENIEVAPPEKPQKAPSLTTNKSTSSLLSTSASSTSSLQYAGGQAKFNLPDNQETVVPDNEERPSYDSESLAMQMNSLRLNAASSAASQQVVPPVSASDASSIDQWNAAPGWENQEVAPSPSPVNVAQEQAKRFTVDRNQYLETGHLSSNPAHMPSSFDNDVDNNDEEAAPPPGLHRLVTGQVTPGDVDSSSADSSAVPVVTSQDGVMQRMVVGWGQESSLGTRLVTGLPSGGEQANQDGGAQQSSSAREPVSQSQVWRMATQGERPEKRLVPGQGDVNEERLVAGQVDEQPPPLGQRLVPGQPSDDEVPNPATVASSSASSSASRGEVPGSRGEVDGGGGDDEDENPPGGRRVPGRQGVDERQMQQQIPGDGQYSDAAATTGPNIASSTSMNTQSDTSQRKTNDQPPPGMHRFVLGHNNSTGDDSRGALSGDEADAGSMSGPSGGGGNLPPPGFHRMVVGELRGKEKDADRSRDKDTDAEDREKDRDTEYSDSEYRINRSRKTRPRRDSYDDDDRDSRDCPSDRERHHHYQDYWERHWDSGGGSPKAAAPPPSVGGRHKQRNQRRSADRHSYDHSPEYRSDDEFDHRDRHDYRDHRRDRDRDRDRGDNDRERRRRSPRPYRDDYYYRQDDYRDDPRRRRGDRRMHYDYRAEDYYSRENRSRPTSRSGSDYRRQGAPRDFVPTPRHHSSAYYPDPGAVNPYQYYYQMQQYYEEMRRTDPQRYASWYEQYMSGKLQYGQMPPGSATHASDTDRASVHSGRSSAQAHHTNSHTDHSVNDMSKTGDEEFEAESQRNTPPLFMGAHCKAHFSRQNQLAVIWPHYDGSAAAASVSLLQLSSAAVTADSCESDLAELLECPGPFTAGVTHKSTVVQYLKRRSEMSSRSSERLLYDLILLVVRLNGVVDKNDVAELLLSSYKESKVQCQQSAAEEEVSLSQQEVQGWSIDGNMASATSPPPPTLPQHEVVAKFRDLLLEGNKSDALEWAIQNKIWGHAFFLAYKMDARTYNNVILRFANGLSVNDPLQTLYQTMSGREPQAATCAADKKWGDWRTHLAMMLSNPSGNADLDRKSVITLGDSLANRGRLFAAHFCYLTAQVKFSDYTDRAAKLVLLGSSHQQLPFPRFATCRAIMLSLCYEYAMRLNKKDFVMPALQTYKYLLAVRLAECNKLTSALQHLEYLAVDLTNLPTSENRQLAIRVAELADQLKLADPSLALLADPDEDPDWLAGLKQMLDDISDTNLPSTMSRAISTSTVSTSGADLNSNQQGMEVPMYGDSTNVHSWGQQQQTPMTYDPSQTDNSGMLNPNAVPMISNLQQPYQQSQFQPDYSTPTTYGIDQPISSIPQQQNQQQPWDQAANSWQNQQMYQQDLQQQQQYGMQDQQQHEINHQPTEHGYSNSGITLNSGPSSYYNSASQQQQQQQQQQQPLNDNKSQEAKAQSVEKSSRKTNKKAKEASNSTGWFGGIWNTLTLKPKNQMKLPDDKNPSIIWDEKRGKWVNTDADEEDEAEKLKPPPKASDIPGFRAANIAGGAPPTDNGALPPGVPTMQPVQPTAAAPIPTLATGVTSLISQPLQPLTNNAASAATNAAPAATGPPSVNMYKMKRGKGIKSNYVNVLDSIKNSSHQQPPAADLMMPSGPSSLPPPTNNFFIPAPMEGNENAPIDFLTPSGPVSYESTSQGKSLDQQQPAEAPYGSLQQSATYYR